MYCASEWGLSYLICQLSLKSIIFLTSSFSNLRLIWAQEYVIKIIATYFFFLDFIRGRSKRATVFDLNVRQYSNSIRWLCVPDERLIPRRLSDLIEAVWLDNVNYLTHFCEQVCAATIVTVIRQTWPMSVGMFFFSWNRCNDTCVRCTVTVKFLGLESWSVFT